MNVDLIDEYQLKRVGSVQSNVVDETTEAEEQNASEGGENE